MLVLYLNEEPINCLPQGPLAGGAGHVRRLAMLKGPRSYQLLGRTVRKFSDNAGGAKQKGDPSSKQIAAEKFMQEVGLILRLHFSVI